jgi:hypothetical protein
VSRCHAIIKCKQDGFYIEDNTSKFGTIILLKNKLRLKAQHTMAVQVGRTVISFTIKYVQSERDKLKSDVSKVLDSKNKAFKGMPVPLPANKGAPGLNNNYPLHMQQTQYNAALNQPMANAEGDNDVEDGEPQDDNAEARDMNDL